MEELFRFSVIRPTTRSRRQTISLDRLPVTAQPAVQTAVLSPVPQAQQVIAAHSPTSAPTLPASGTPAMIFATGIVQAQLPGHKQSFQDQLREIVAQSHLSCAEVIWKAFEDKALNFLLTDAPGILGNSLWANLQELLDAVQQALTDAGSAVTLSRLLTSRKTDIAQSTALDYQLDLADLFLALLIVRRGGASNVDMIIRSRRLWSASELLRHNPTLQDVADRIRLIDLINTGVDGDSGVARGSAAAGVVPSASTQAGNGRLADKPAAIQRVLRIAMNKTLVLPQGIFAPMAKPVQGVGFRELHVVKQHIRRYEMAEIGRIENILKGESRDHSLKHTLSNETETYLETETTEESEKELTTADRADIQNEAENQVKTDTKLDAGAHAQYDGGSFKAQADLTTSYDKATEETKKFSSEVAKEVTQKAVTKATQRLKEAQRAKLIQTLEETESQSFDNKKGLEHVSGVYQWVQKVYLAQVFNLGRHMLLDIMVPEPAASLLAAATVEPKHQDLPIQPLPPGTFHIDLTSGRMVLDDPLKPEQLTSDIEANQWVVKYHATGVTPKPGTIVAAKHGVFNYADDNVKNGGDVIQLPDGYEAKSAVVSATWCGNDNPNGEDYRVYITVGGKATTLASKVQNGRYASDCESVNFSSMPAGVFNQQGNITFAFVTQEINALSLTVEVTCQPAAQLVGKWQLQTYDRIITAWQALETEYQKKLAEMGTEKPSTGPLGAADPEANRLTERVELKRQCIAILDNSNATVRGTDGAVEDWPAQAAGGASQDGGPLSLPEPILQKTQQLAATVRWFEQAFDWQNIAYVFYPYFWGRRENWIRALNLQNDDPLFLNFLQAGYARVLVPVRLGFEYAVQFYLNTGLPWLGGDLPPVGDATQNPLYLDIAEEIKELTGGGEGGTPVDEPWEYVLPTSLMKLRKDDALPEWHRVGPDGKENMTKYPSDAPDSEWAWRAEQPGKA